jgi:hypothetical protein
MYVYVYVFCFVRQAHINKLTYNLYFRIILTSCPIGYSKVLLLLIENTVSKIPILRKNVMEYLCLCCTLWKSEIIMKSFGGVYVCLYVLYLLLNRCMCVFVCVCVNVYIHEKMYINIHIHISLFTYIYIH